MESLLHNINTRLVAIGGLDGLYDQSRISKNGKAAIAYASRLGWLVFPLHTIINERCTCNNADCKNQGKHPRTMHGYKDASNDLEQIRQWWAKWPDANIGIPTGERNGFFVVDVDPRHAGFETLAELIGIYGNLPHTITAITGSGGKHFLFKYFSRHVKSGSNVLGPGIDIRGEGGYIVAAPSNHISGNAYTWELNSRPKQTSIAKAPEWLLNMLNRTNRHREENVTGTPSGEWVGLMNGVEDGGRNSAAVRLIGHLLRRYVDSYLAYEIVKLWNCKNKPPINERELRRTFDSIGLKELQRRRTK